MRSFACAASRSSALHCAGSVWGGGSSYARPSARGMGLGWRVDSAEKPCRLDRGRQVAAVLLQKELVTPGFDMVNDFPAVGLDPNVTERSIS